MNNPFEKLVEYTPEALKAMNREELIEAQRSVLFPHEKQAFEEGTLRFAPGDSRDEFFEFTDRLLC